MRACVRACLCVCVWAHIHTLENTNQKVAALRPDHLRHTHVCIGVSVCAQTSCHIHILMCALGYKWVCVNVRMRAHRCMKVSLCPSLFPSPYMHIYMIHIHTYLSVSLSLPLSLSLSIDICI